MDQSLNISVLRGLVTSMVRIRAFEERVAELCEAGEVQTPCHLYIGQEAIAAGVCRALEVTDYVWGGHRSHGHYLAKGGDMRAMMAEIFCKADGCSRGRGGSMHLVAREVGLLGTVPLVAATIPMAVGAALASRLRKDERVSVAFFGDGATDEGHFHESLNLAAIYNLPAVFVCENNFYSSHMHLLEHRSSGDIHLSGQTHGVPGIRADGNDVSAVYESSMGAVSRARRGEGPTLLEYETYRWRGHVGPSWDMDVGVQRRDEIGAWIDKDPIKRARDALLASGISESELEREEAQARTDVDDAVTFARNADYPDESELIEHVYATPNREAARAIT